MLVDHHTHVFSERARQVVSRAIGRELATFAFGELSRELDGGEVSRAMVLSVAYLHPEADETAPENDWVAAGCVDDDRLAPFFSLNPLADHAFTELDRCANLGIFSGLKLHLANSGVDLLDANQRRRLVALLSRASLHALPVVLHLRSTTEFGRVHAESFVRHLAPAARDIPIQIAHLGGWGGYDEPTRAAFAALRAAIDDDHLIYLDVSAVVRGNDLTAFATLAADLREMPNDRLLFGTDWPDWTASSYTSSLAAVGVHAYTTTAPWMRA